MEKCDDETLSNDLTFTFSRYAPILRLAPSSRIVARSTYESYDSRKSRGQRPVDGDAT